MPGFIFIWIIIKDKLITSQGCNKMSDSKIVFWSYLERFSAECFRTGRSKSRFYSDQKYWGSVRLCVDSAQQFGQQDTIVVSLYFQMRVHKNCKKLILKWNGCQGVVVKGGRVDARRITNIRNSQLLFLPEYLALSCLNLPAQLSDWIYYFTALNSVHVRKLG